MWGAPFEHPFCAATTFCFAKVYFLSIKNIYLHSVYVLILLTARSFLFQSTFYFILELLNCVWSCRNTFIIFFSKVLCGLLAEGSVISFFGTVLIAMKVVSILEAPSFSFINHFSWVNY